MLGVESFLICVGRIAVDPLKISMVDLIDTQI